MKKSNIKILQFFSGQTLHNLTGKENPKKAFKFHDLKPFELKKLFKQNSLAPYKYQFVSSSSTSFLPWPLFYIEKALTLILLTRYIYHICYTNAFIINSIYVFQRKERKFISIQIHHAWSLFPHGECKRYICVYMYIKEWRKSSMEETKIPLIMSTVC